MEAVVHNRLLRRRHERSEFRNSDETGSKIKWNRSQALCKIAVKKDYRDLVENNCNGFLFTVTVEMQQLSLVDKYKLLSERCVIRPFAEGIKMQAGQR